VGASDIRKDQQGSLDFRLQRQLCAYSKQDPPPNSIKPVPIQILFHALAAAHNPGTVPLQAIANMAVLAFFYLLRPGKYTSASANSTPFTLANIQLFIGDQQLDLATASNANIQAATHSSLTFTTQKSGVCSKVVSHGRSGSPLCCPTLALI
jgi:hypothetical protein